MVYFSKHLQRTAQEQMQEKLIQEIFINIGRKLVDPNFGKDKSVDESVYNVRRNKVKLEDKKEEKKKNCC